MEINQPRGDYAPTGVDYFFGILSLYSCNFPVLDTNVLDFINIPGRVNNTAALD